jgi:hypothetical protein
MTHLINNLSQVLQVILALHAAALIIVNMTKTPQDDKAVAAFYRVIEFMAGFVTKLAKR